MIANRKVLILMGILALSLGVILTVKSESKESVTIYRYVSPFGEKVVRSNDDVKKLKAIINEIDIEFERENDLIITGPVYLVRFGDGGNVEQYGFWSNKMHYVNLKDGEKVVDKWYKSNEDNLAKVEEIFFGP